MADEALGISFASYASVALANARTYWRAQQLADQLAGALSPQGVIEQAKGIIIAYVGSAGRVGALISGRPPPTRPASPRAARRTPPSPGTSPAGTARPAGR